MPLFRLLIIALIIGGTIYIYRRIKNRPSSQQQQPPQVHSTHALKCEFCGLHIPEPEAIHYNNHVYCCQDHANKASSQ